MALKDAVKRKCNVTWSEDVTEERFDEFISDAILTMRHKIGAAKDFSFETIGPDRNLFLNYCLYEWNNNVHLFDSNYQNDILQARARHLVKSMEAGDDGG